MHLSLLTLNLIFPNNKTEETTFKIVFISSSEKLVDLKQLIISL